MTDPLTDLSEEISELDAQIARLKGSMGKADNGVKIAKLAIITRIRARSMTLKQDIERRAAQ